MPAMSSITPAAVNLHGPSLASFGAQQMSMLEAMQASNPPIAPTMPGIPPMKPTSEKMELPHRQELAQQCSRSCVHTPAPHMCQPKGHVFGLGGRRTR
eukprot:scaffold75982_cov65-Phaeocystis_antarctica.AAC.8